VLPRIAAGDKSAVRACIDRYGGMVYGLARRFLRDPSAADDASQEIFIELWKVAARFDRSAAKESTFILTIARRRLIDRLRRDNARVKTDSFETVPEPATDMPIDQVEQRDMALQAMSAMRQLPPDQQKVLMLAIEQGLSYSEIAERLGTPLGTIKSHARRGLIRIRELLAVEQTREVE